MDSRTLLAVALMMLIYMFFFQSKPTKDLNHVAANQVTLSKANSSVQQKGQLQVENIERELKNSKVHLLVNPLGTVKRAEFSLFSTPESQSSVVYDFSKEGFNWDFISGPSGAFSEFISKQVDARTLDIVGKSGNLELKRTVELTEDGYYLAVKNIVVNRGTNSAALNFNLSLSAPLGDHTASEKQGFLQRMLIPSAQTHESILYRNGSLVRTPLEKISENETTEGSFLYSGFGEKYFFFGLVFEDFSPGSAQVYKVQDAPVVQDFNVLTRTLAPNESSEFSYKVYVGPKELAQLEKTLPEMRDVIDYGSWLGPIARLLLSILYFFYSLIPNFGVGIILLTILVKLILFPLAFKGAVSMRKLQLVQPKMKEIKDRYKEDKQKMQVEMMALYKTEKVNPVGGCLPMLLQMPVFFALYRVFYISIEFWHEPFFGWIKDLSSHDPLFVTPILLTILMWYQTKTTPQAPSMEESEAILVQKAMMKWLPIVFGAVSIFLPSGLNIYLVVNVLLSIAQQVYMNKHLSEKFPIQVASRAD